MFEHVLLGIVQGIAEWLPVSSEGIISLIKINFFQNFSLSKTISFALFLHFGTALAATVYFWKDIFSLIKNLFKFKESGEKNKKITIFLVISTIVSGLIGLLILQLLPDSLFSEVGTKIFTIFVGLMLLVTAGLQIFKVKERSSHKRAEKINISDTLILSIAQGIAVIPGLSRSGLTVSAFLLLGYDKKESLKLSFLMSIPIVIVGNVILQFSHFSPASPNAVFGLLTIGALVKLAEKINFGYFVLFFAVITLIAGVFL